MNQSEIKIKTKLFVDIIPAWKLFLFYAIKMCSCAVSVDICITDNDLYRHASNL